MKKILITGAAGFIGYHLTKHLLRKTGVSLTLVDNLMRGAFDKEFKTILKDTRVRFLKLDLTDLKSFTKLNGPFHYVYHLAAVNGTKHFYKIPHEVLRINVISLYYMLEWMRRKNIKGKFLFPSSNEAYAGALEAFGKLPIPTKENIPLIVADPYNSRWTYAGTKLIGEQFVIHYAEQYGFKAVIVRPHNFYGPRAGFDHVIPEFSLRIARHTDPFPIYGGMDTRTFCYIDDAVRAMEMVMSSEKTDSQPPEIVHIGDVEEIRMKELALRMFEVATWRPAKIALTDSPLGSVKRRRADITKLQTLVGWKPEVSLDEGLRRTYEWYEAHLPMDAT